MGSFVVPAAPVFGMGAYLSRMRGAHGRHSSRGSLVAVRTGLALVRPAQRRC
jgi:hypothetical protein